MSFSKIIGLQQPIEVIRRAIAGGRVSHAYLFHGPPNIGKTLLATEMAKTFNCDTLKGLEAAASTDCCDQCPSCVHIDKGAHADVRTVRPMAKIQAEGDEGVSDVVIEGAMITNDQISELIVDASLKATRARRKVFIVASAEAMHIAAANRLLKTLEEPPPATTVILTTQNMSSLLPTIISRCQLIKCHPATVREAEEGLTARYPHLEPGALRSIVALSGGRIGWAMNLLEHPEALQLREDLLDLAQSVPGRDWCEGMAMGERLIDAARRWWLATEDADFAEKALKASPDRICRTRMNQVLDILLTWFRDLALLTGEGDPALVINGDRLEALTAIAPTIRPERIREVCSDIEETRRQFRGNANLRLTAELLSMKLIRACR